MCFMRLSLCRTIKKLHFWWVWWWSKVYKVTGVKDSPGNFIDDIYAFNNIGALVSALFYPGESRVTDISGHNHAPINECSCTRH